MFHKQLFRKVPLIPISMLGAQLGFAQSINIEFNTDKFVGGSGPTSGLDLAGNPYIGTNGMGWGIVVDTNGDGFSSDVVTFNTTTDQYLSNGVSVTDDYFVSGGTTLDNTSTAGPPPSPYFHGDGGLIDSIMGVDLTGPVAAGQEFALFWTDGTEYGLLEDTGVYEIGAAGGTYSFETETSATILSDRVVNMTLIPIPEPSGVLLAGVALMLSACRRRRTA